MKGNQASRTEVPSADSKPDDGCRDPRWGCAGEVAITSSSAGDAGGAAVACIAACAVGNYWYWTQNGQRQPVIELGPGCPAGSVISDSDLQWRRRLRWIRR